MRKDYYESPARAENSTARTWRFGLLRHTLSSPLLFLDVRQPLVLVPVLNSKVPAHTIEVSHGELLGVVADHRRATQASAEVFGTGADGGGVVGVALVGWNVGGKKESDGVVDPTQSLRLSNNLKPDTQRCESG